MNILTDEWWREIFVLDNHAKGLLSVRKVRAVAGGQVLGYAPAKGLNVWMTNPARRRSFWH